VAPAAEAATLATASGSGNGWVAFKVSTTAWQTTATFAFRGTGPIGENAFNLFFTNAQGAVFSYTTVLFLDRDQGFLASVEGPMNVAVTHGGMAAGPEPYAWIDILYQVSFPAGTWNFVAMGAGTQNGWSASLDGPTSLTVLGQTSGSNAIFREAKDFRGTLNLEAYDVPALGARAMLGTSLSNTVGNLHYGSFIAVSPKYACAGYCVYPPPVAQLSVTSPSNVRTTAGTLQTSGWSGGTLTGIVFLGGMAGTYRYTVDHEAEASSAFGTGNPCPGTLGCTRPYETKIMLAAADVRLPA